MLPSISTFLERIQNSPVKPTIINDSRGTSPGGTVILNLTRDRGTFATLSIRTIHPDNDSFSNVDSYLITEVIIDNAEVIKIRKPTTAAILWDKVENLLRDRYERAHAAAAYFNPPRSTNNFQSRNQPRYRQRRRQQRPSYQFARA